MANKNTKPNKSELVPRPPIVVIMGHVDHGKSTLLDYIRNANIVAKEAGGITQHVGAYEAEVKHGGAVKKITFLDTPGHEAFTKMRIRGAATADIAVLVVAADEGIKPQTIEAYGAIKEAGLPFIVAINKIDKPDAQPEKIKSQLAENGIYVEGYGGNVPFANISAKTGQGVPDLLDLILLQAELEDLKADPNQNASGIVIESNLDTKRGVSSTLIIKNGAMTRGKYVVSGEAIAPIRIFEDFRGKMAESATFSSPVRITGFNSLPEVGSAFTIFDTKKEAEQAAEKYRQEKISARKTPAEKTLPTRKEEKSILIPLVIKTDVAGSLDALEKELMKLQDEETEIAIIKKGVGNIGEEDAKFASTAENAIVFGFNSSMDSSAKEIIERNKIRFFSSDIIYKISDWLKEEIERRKAEIPREEIIGTAKILKTFSRQKNKQVIGGKVVSGKLLEGKTFKIKRRDTEIGEGKITNLQQGKKEVKEVETGLEFGAMTENKIEISKDDEIVLVGK